MGTSDSSGPSEPAGSRARLGQQKRFGGEGGPALFPGLAFQAGAGEHTVPIKSPVLCCVFSWRLGGVVGRRGSCQTCSRKGFVEGDPSLTLAPVMDCPMWPYSLAFWTVTG